LESILESSNSSLSVANAPFSDSLSEWTSTGSIDDFFWTIWLLKDAKTGSVELASCFSACSFCSSKLSNSLRQETNVVTVKPQPSSITNDFGSNNKFFDDPENKFFYRRYIKCTNINCPPPHTCVDNTVCKCGENFADLGRNVDIYCAHNQRQQITAFLLGICNLVQAGMSKIRKISWVKKGGK
jgi:hypothetical protein